MSATMLLYLFDGFADWEPAYLCAGLATAGWKILSVSRDGRPVRSMGGLLIQTDCALSAVPRAFDLLVLPGGAAWLDGGNDAALPLVRHAAKSSVPIGAICNAAAFLAMHGFLNVIRHTGNTLAFLQACAPRYTGGALFEERQAVCDGGIVTANGYAALAFTREVMRLVGCVPEEGSPENWYAMHRSGFYPD